VLNGIIFFPSFALQWAQGTIAKISSNHFVGRDTQKQRENTSSGYSNLLTLI